MSSGKWEYTISQVTFHTPPIDLTKPKSIDALEAMQKMGENGWELINMIQQNMLFTFFWKKEKKKSGESWTI